MNCTQIEKLIPLYVGGDLKSSEIEEVRRHTELCAHCREIVAEFEESQSWLRDFAAPQFDEAVFDDLRDAVRSEIVQTKPRRSSFALFAPLWNPRFVIGGSLALTLLVAGLAIYLYRQQSNPISVARFNNGDNAETKEPPVTDDGVSTRSGGEVTAQGGAEGNPVYVAKKRSNQRSRRQKTISPTMIDKPEIKSAIDAELALNRPSIPDKDPEMTRIEIQTADPSIRIIWLAPKDSNPSSTKSNTNDR